MVSKISDHFKNTNFKRIDEENKKLYELIVNETSERELSTSVELLYEKIKSNLQQSLEQILKPNYKFIHIREPELRFWGKKENIALGKNTLLELYDSLNSLIEDKQALKNKLFLAGRKSAYFYFDEFCHILYKENDLRYCQMLPELVKLLSEFDKNCAWWDREFDIKQGDKLLKFTVFSPFTKYPWIEECENDFDHFIAGYILTVYNCCADLLRIINALEERSRKYKFCSGIEIVDDSFIDKSVFKLNVKSDYLDNFRNIDEIILALGQYLTLYDLSENINLVINNILDTFKILFELIKNNCNSIDIKSFIHEIDVLDKIARTHNWNFIRHKFYKLLVLLRIEYDNHRFGILGKGL